MIEIALQGGRRNVASALADIACMVELLLDDPSVLRFLQRTVGRMYSREANPLTVRETAVLSLVAAGASTSAIARQLGIAENTVKNHLRNIHQKLGVRCRPHAVAIATRAGWLPEQSHPESVWLR